MMENPAPSHPRSFSFWICTWFGLGLLPKAPGTWGSLGGVVFMALLSWMKLPYPWIIGVIGVLCVSGIFATMQLLKQEGQNKDPSHIVIDEVAGQMIALLPVLAAPPLYWVVGFCLFRLFDIWKPWPIKWADQYPSKTLCQAAIMIMLDDVLAGLLAGMIVAWALLVI